jgi:predicted ATPase
LLSGATYELVRDHLPPDGRLRDLGARRLKGLIRPECVWQVLAPGLPAAFPPLKTLDARANNLPLPLTSFVGREPELAEVARLLGAARLLTLTGAGGVGKTRLAVQVAANVLDNYPAGAWFVDLAPLADPALVTPTAAGVLNIRETPGQPLLATLAEALRPRRLLLILDNCEHLVAAAVELAARLLQTCPELRVLATSREALGVSGATTYRVPSLRLPDPQHVPDLPRLPQYEAVRLFMDRALAVQPSFQVTNVNAPALVELCVRLDGIPLAIELAAARVRVLSLEQIAARLDDRFRLLTGGSRTALPRQQTLRALIDWSYDLLTSGERRLLGRLAVFAGGWTLEAAEAVCAGAGVDEPEVLDLLTRLVDKSVVLYEEPSAGGASDGARYRLLETLRQYAGEKLRAAGDPEATEPARRRLGYFLALAERAEPELKGARQLAWLRGRRQPESPPVPADRGRLWAPGGGRAGGGDGPGQHPGAPSGVGLPTGYQRRPKGSRGVLPPGELRAAACGRLGRRHRPVQGAAGTLGPRW